MTKPEELSFSGIKTKAIAIWENIDNNELVMCEYLVLI